MELDWNRLEAVFGRVRKVPWFDQLRDARVVVRDAEETPRPSFAGLLTFGSNPTDRLQGARIEAACYRGTRCSRVDLVHEERQPGRAPDQIDRAVGFVMRFAGASRPNREPLYDLGAVQEAIVNAVIHRDYSIPDAPIRLTLFSDRLELASPGKPPGSLTLEEMPHRTCSRNDVLIHFLTLHYAARTGRPFIESRGQGVRKILERGEAHSGCRPTYKLLREELRLTIRAKTP